MSRNTCYVSFGVAEGCAESTGWSSSRVERFLSFVDMDRHGCWLWTASRFRRGYGQFTRTVKGYQQHVYAHRVAYELTRGPIPAGLVVMHMCDNPPCCNPAHLRLGTQADNLEDARRKLRLIDGRQHEKFTPEQVAAIRAAYTGARGQQRALARQYGVTPPTIKRIADGVTYKRLAPHTDKAA